MAKYTKKGVMMESIGYVDDNTTCKGNDHNPNDEAEITEWYIESSK